MIRIAGCLFRLRGEQMEISKKVIVVIFAVGAHQETQHDGILYVVRMKAQNGSRMVMVELR